MGTWKTSVQIRAAQSMGRAWAGDGQGMGRGGNPRKTEAMLGHAGPCWAISRRRPNDAGGQMQCTSRAEDLEVFNSVLEICELLRVALLLRGG